MLVSLILNELLYSDSTGVSSGEMKFMNTTCSNDMAGVCVCVCACVRVSICCFMYSIYCFGRLFCSKHLACCGFFWIFWWFNQLDCSGIVLCKNSIDLWKVCFMHICLSVCLSVCLCECMCHG